MERGSSKHGSRIDDEMSDENQTLERAGKEGRAEEAREGERAGREDADADETERGTAPDSHLEGTQSSADTYPHQEHEEGGASHPKPDRRNEDKKNEVEEASEESFPASDPPGW